MTLVGVVRCANCGRFVAYDNADGYSYQAPNSADKEQMLYHAGYDCDDLTMGAD